MRDWIIQAIANRVGASWRTGVLGALLILGAIAQAGVALFDDDPKTLFTWEDTSTKIIAGVALMAARDNKVTSEQAIGNPPVGAGNTKIGKGGAENPPN